MALNRYELGATVQITCAFYADGGTDAEGNALLGPLTDPTLVILRLEKPDGTISVYRSNVDITVIIRDSTGAYHANFVTAQAGDYQYRWEGSGAVAAVGKGVFQVATPNVAVAP